MLKNHSPWIHQLKRTRPAVPLDKDAETDVVVVGGGIAGIATAYFLLKETNKRVLLLEADKVAHGASGHNAGQITSYFERPIHDIAKEFGLSMAIAGQRAVESAWTLIDQMIADTSLKTPLYRFTGYAGCTGWDDLETVLKNNTCRLKGGLPIEAILVAKEFDRLNDIPKMYRDLYSVAPQSDILGLLETNNPDYIASFSYQKGCTNSALLCEELLAYLTSAFKDRFSFFEQSPVKTLILRDKGGVVKVGDFTILCERIVLCTNGFTHFTIQNLCGSEVDTSFHHSIHGRIGYMAGYVEPLDNPPAAISYFLKENDISGDPTGDAYFYLTRRPHEHEEKKNVPHNLICTGGPEKVLPNMAVYSREDELSEEYREKIDMFLRQNYGKYPGEPTEYAFSWHGLMGYTPNGIRRIGAEPCNPVLLYNLGCNGVGILPSIYGGKRIAQIVRGDTLEPSIFDPGKSN